MKRDNLKIAEPCTESWDEMTGEGATRFCDKCTKNVHNLSDMTRDEATKFLNENGESGVCVIYKFDSRNGAVKFKEPSARKPSLKQLLGVKKLLAAAALIAPLAAGCDTYEPPRSECAQEEMVRPIDIIMEQERALMSFFESLFEGDEPMIMGAIAPPEEMLMGEPAYVPPLEELEEYEEEMPEEVPQPETIQRVMGDVAWEPPTIEPAPAPEPAVEHTLREELDNAPEIPIRRLMGKIAPVRVQDLDDTHEYIE